MMGEEGGRGILEIIKAILSGESFLGILALGIMMLCAGYIKSFNRDDNKNKPALYYIALIVVIIIGIIALVGLIIQWSA